MGLAIAKELQSRGFDLLIVATEAQLPPDSAKQLSNKTRVEYFQGDITSSKSMEALAKTCRAKFGKIDLLVSNAGIFLMGAIEEFDVASWDKIIAVNLKGGFLVTKALVGLLKESKGQIVFINSVGGKVGLKHLSAYSASKFGLRGLTDSLRLELKPFGIRVTSIFPQSMNSAGEKIDPNDPKRMTIIETSDVARLVGEVADSNLWVQIPEIDIYPRSTEISKRET